MANVVAQGPSDSGFPLERVRAALSETNSKWLSPHGIVVTHRLTPEFIDAMQPLPEICLVAEINGAPDYFDLISAEEALATELGLDVIIIPRRAVTESVRELFDASLVPL